MITFFILQIANAMGVNSVNIVRDRPNIDELKNYLKDLGATIVVTEKELRYDFFYFLHDKVYSFKTFTA